MANSLQEVQFLLTRVELICAFTMFPYGRLLAPHQMISELATTHPESEREAFLFFSITAGGNLARNAEYTRNSAIFEYSRNMFERSLVDTQGWSTVEVNINGPEDLREITRGSDVEAVQLKPGKLYGSIAHIGIGNLGISLGRLSSGIRMRGALHRERVVLGIAMDSAGPVTQWWQDVLPGDVGVFPAGGEFDAVHCGGAAYLTVSIGLPELLSMLGGEDGLADPAFWNTRGIFHPDPRTSEAIRQRLKGIMSEVERRTTAPSPQSAEFLQRSIIEAFVVILKSALPPEKENSFYTGARVVTETEDYVDAAGERPVHISEICSALKLSRRSLHRAFANTLDVGPVAYLRRRRLSAVRSVLSRSDPETISIGDVAFEHGFPESGRFAAYYRAHFCETPSETCRSRSVRVSTMTDGELAH